MIAVTRLSMDRNDIVDVTFGGSARIRGAPVGPNSWPAITMADPDGIEYYQVFLEAMKRCPDDMYRLFDPSLASQRRQELLR